jgi:hypothetical protein
MSGYPPPIFTLSKAASNMASSGQNGSRQERVVSEIEMILDSNVLPFVFWGGGVYAIFFGTSLDAIHLWNWIS